MGLRSSMSRKRSAPPVQIAATQKQETEVRILLNDPEKGTSGLKEWGGFISEAYNQALFLPGAADLYKRLITSCPEVVMKNMGFNAWAQNVTPQCDLPEKPTDDDKRFKDFRLSEYDNMEGGFGRYLSQAMVTSDVGFSFFTISPSLRDPSWVPPDFIGPNGEREPDEWRSEANDGLIGIRRLAYRDFSTLYRWDMSPQKRLNGFVQQDFPNPQVTLPLNYDPKTGQAGSLHHTFGNPNNPEGTALLQAVWRLERLKYGFEVVYGIGVEKAAGYLNVKKTTEGAISDPDKRNVKDVARSLLTAQEGNYAYWPFGIEGEVKDISFSAAPSLLEIIKHYSVLMLSVYMMQFVALNTMTSTGAQASQVDSTNTAIFNYNSFLDGLAAQFDAQVGKRLYLWNKHAFPNLTQRPRDTFSHIKNNLAMQELGSFFSSINGIIPLGADDYKALRKESGWLPENAPEGDDILSGLGSKAAASPSPIQFQPPTNPDGSPMTNPDGTPMMAPGDKAQLSYNALRSKLTVWRRGEQVEL